MGKEIWPDGTIYEGEYKNGEKEGKGEYNFPQGDRYIGEFKLN